MATSGDDGSRQAAEFMSRAIEVVASHDKARPDAEGARLIFPDGIDMISLKFKIGTAVDISLAISGKSCCKNAGLAESTDGSGRARLLRSALASTSFDAGAERSLESDAIDCLVEAIRQRFNVHVGPEEFEDLKPSDVGAQDDLKWLKCLNTAARCLRNKGWPIEDFDSAGVLFDKTLIASLKALINAAR